MPGGTTGRSLSNKCETEPPNQCSCCASSKCSRTCRARGREESDGKNSSNGTHEIPVVKMSIHAHACAHTRGGPFHSSRRSIYAYICTFVTYLFLPLPLPLPCSCTTASVGQAKTSQQVKYQHEKRKKNKGKQSERRSPLKSTSHPVALNPLPQRRIHYMHAF